VSGVAVGSQVDTIHREIPVPRLRRKALWNHWLRFSLPWWPPIIVWSAHGSLADSASPAMFVSTTVVLSGEYLLLPRDAPWRRQLFGLVPLVLGVILLIGPARFSLSPSLGWLAYLLAALGWGWRAHADAWRAR
jgi:drug/metabolite transporter (DMT)-like permease